MNPMDSSISRTTPVSFGPPLAGAMVSAAGRGKRVEAQRPPKATKMHKIHNQGTRSHKESLGSTILHKALGFSWVEQIEHLPLFQSPGHGLTLPEYYRFNIQGGRWVAPKTGTSSTDPSQIIGVQIVQDAFRGTGCYQDEGRPCLWQPQAQGRPCHPVVGQDEEKVQGGLGRR